MGHKKRTKKPITKTEKANQKLQAALKRFDTDQGRVARRNARKALTSALNAIRRAADAEYPTIRKPPKRTGRLSIGVRRRRLEERNLVPVDNSVWRHIKAQAIAVEKDPLTKDAEKKNARLADLGKPLEPVPLKGRRWVPRWAADFQELCKQVVLTPPTLKRLWTYAKRRSERPMAEAELYVRIAGTNGLSTSLRRSAIRRLRKDDTFCNAVLAVGPIGTTKQLIEAQLDTQHVRKAS